jgi:hypothetical protein
MQYDVLMESWNKGKSWKKVDWKLKYILKIQINRAQDQKSHLNSK